MLMRRKYSGGMFAGVDDGGRSMVALAHPAKNLCAGRASAAVPYWLSDGGQPGGGQGVPGIIRLSLLS
jgi:hypothetical protein